MSTSSRDPVELLHWSVQDVVEWLSELRLSQDYSMVFKEYRVDGRVLLKISHSYLDQLQIFNEKDKLQILQSVSVLRMNLMQKDLPTLAITDDTGDKFISPINVFSPTLIASDEVERETPKEPKKLQKKKIKHKSKSVDEVLNESTSSSKEHFPKSLTPTPYQSPVSSHMLNILREENTMLKKELDLYYQKVCKLQKLEQELEHVREAHKLLEATTSRKEKLELAIRNRLEEELRKYKESSIRQEVQLHTIKQNASFKAAKPDKIIKRELARRDSVIAKLIKQNQDVTTAREQLEKDLCCMKSNLGFANNHKGSDDDEQHEEFPFANENQMAYTYTSSIEKLQTILSTMNASSQKTQHLELQLRKQLEARVSELQEGREIKSDYRSDELKVSTLQADIAKLEHKCLEFMAERQFMLDTAIIPRETKINQLERQLKEKEKELGKNKEHKILYMQQLEESKHKIAVLDNRVSSLEASLKEKDLLIETLQSLLEPDDSTEESSVSSEYNITEPHRKQSVPNYKPVNQIRKTSSPLLSPYHNESNGGNTDVIRSFPGVYTNGYSNSVLPPLPTYDQHIQGSLRNNGVINECVSMVPSSLGPPITHFQPEICSHSFPNTPEVQRRFNPHFSAPNSHQGSPLPIQRKKPRPISKSLTPPPQKFLQGPMSHLKSQNEGTQLRVMKSYYSAADAKSLDSDDSIDSLLSPSSPPSALQSIISPSEINKHRHSNSFPNSARRTDLSGQYGESHSQDSGVLIESIYHRNYQL